MQKLGQICWIQDYKLRDANKPMLTQPSELKIVNETESEIMPLRMGDASAS